MWPILIGFMRSYAPYITLPVAAVVGVVGYYVEGMISDKYTPYQGSIQDKRTDRLTDEEGLKNAANVKSLKYSENVLGKNLSPSLSQ